MRARVPLIKSLATIATLSSGGSAGKEGPIAQIGAGIGSALGRFIKMGARARRTMMVAGAAAGLGAIFRAPLGGALTAVEVLYKEDSRPTRSRPAILSSVTAYTVFCSVKGFNHVFAFDGTTSSTRRWSCSSTRCSVWSARASGYLYVRFLHGIEAALLRSAADQPVPGSADRGSPGGRDRLLLSRRPWARGFGYVQQLIRGRAPSAAMQATASACSRCWRC